MNPEEITDLIIRFNDALNAADVEAMMRLQTPDCVFENTSPPPDGARIVGAQAVREFWQAFFQGSSEARIEPEEVFAMGDRGVMRWTYRWKNDKGESGHMRGVDIYTVRDGRIAEKLSYVKG
jgi:uncharacterized protein (TIGR02246 family)